MKTIVTSVFSAFSKPKRTIDLAETHVVHFRNYSDHLWSSDGPMAKGGVTVAFTIDDKANVKAAVAVCSSHDNFCRKTGRDLALTRLEAKPTGFYYEFEMAPEVLQLNEHVAIEEVANRVLEICPFVKAAIVDLVAFEKSESRLYM